MRDRRRHNGCPGAARALEIRIDPHTLDRARERGTDPDEIRDVIRNGSAVPARSGRFRTTRAYDFGQTRLGKHYERKRVDVIYVQDGDVVTTVTVIVQYGKRTGKSPITPTRTSCTSDLTRKSSRSSVESLRTRLSWMSARARRSSGLRSWTPASIWTFAGCPLERTLSSCSPHNAPSAHTPKADVVRPVAPLPRRARSSHGTR